MTAPKDEYPNVNYKTVIPLLHVRIWVFEFGLHKKRNVL